MNINSTIFEILAELVNSVEPNTTTFKKLRNILIYNNKYFTTEKKTLKWIELNSNLQSIEQYKEDYNSTVEDEFKLNTIQETCNFLLGLVGVSVLEEISIFDDEEILNDESLFFIINNIDPDLPENYQDFEKFITAKIW